MAIAFMVAFGFLLFMFLGGVVISIAFPDNTNDPNPIGCGIMLISCVLLIVLIIFVLFCGLVNLMF